MKGQGNSGSTLAAVVFILGATLGARASATTIKDKPWPAILGPAQGTLPAPLPKVEWRPDLTKALAEAKATNRPVFVTLRCIPCKQCADFDKDVLEGGPALDPLLKQFVTVRLIDASAIDFRLLPVESFQDLDLSWWGWFLSPEGKVYGVYGGKDHVSETTRISVPSLANTLRRVLAHHYDPRRPSWDIDGPAPKLDDGPPVTVKTQPGWANWYKAGGAELHKQACVHCHQVREVLWQPKVDANTFDKQRDFDVWPLPENVGLTLDRDDGLLVKQVQPDSPAAKAGIQPGDSLAAASGRKLFGQADFRAALHRSPQGAGSIDVIWLRNGKPITGTLHVADGWRKTILDWRMSVSQGNVGAYPAFWPLPANDNERKKHGIAPTELAVKPFFGPNPTSPAYQAGIRPSQVVVAVGHEKPNLVGRAFLVWFRMHYEPGDRATFTVIDDKGQRREITYKLPEPGAGVSQVFPPLPCTQGRGPG